MTDVIYALSALILGLAVGKPWIRRMQEEKLGQTVRDDGPQSHLKKTGTPTLGGFIFLAPTFILAIVIAIVSGSLRHLPLLVLVGGAAAIGYRDDRIKIAGDPEGLSVRAKSLALSGLLAAFVIYIVFLRPEPLALGLPWLGWIEIAGIWRAVYALFAFFFLYACINAVNITDGVDGLAGSVTSVVLLALVLGLAIYRMPFMAATQVIPVRGLLSALLGAVLAFVFYNRHPAKIFMGDFGSLALGAFVSGTLLLMGLPFAFLTLGVIYWVEIGSVLVQMMYFRHTGGKRIFRMSPIHHHFELGGWSERKVVLTFSFITVLGAAVTWLLFASLLTV